MRRIDRWQRQHPTVGFPWAVLQKYRDDEAGSKAALIAYYGLLALFPLLLLFTTLVSYLLQENDALRKSLVDSALGTFPIIGAQLKLENHTLQGNGTASVIEAAVLLYAALGLGQATQGAMNSVWNVPYVHRPTFAMHHLRALGVLLLLAASTIGSTVLTGFATLVPHDWATTIVLLAGSITVNFVLIEAAFMIMTAARLRRHDVALGAGLATIFWQVLQGVGSWYIARGLAHNDRTYGFFAVVIVLLSWIYLGAQLFLLAAEINVVRLFHLWPRSIIQPPFTVADKAVLDRLVQMAIRRPEEEAAVKFSPEADIDPTK
jgi:YihY family inner membrane protein